jgi:hypothetical protein
MPVDLGAVAAAGGRVADMTQAGEADQIQCRGAGSRRLPHGARQDRPWPLR